MTKPDTPQRQPLQFTLRKLLLWTFVVALGLGVLAAGQPLPLVWLVLPGWFATVFILRWAFGNKWAGSVSAAAGMLLLGWNYSEALPALMPQRYSYLGAAIYGATLGGLLGLSPLLIIEETCRLIDWLDRIGQSHE